MSATVTTVRDELVYKARLAEQAERYDEMADFMREVVQMSSGDLTVEERNLMSVAYKNAVGARRGALRIIAAVEHKQRTKGNAEQADTAINYYRKVEQELNKTCNDILDLLDKHLIKSGGTGGDSSTTAESQVFYYKMKGDYYRYVSEFSPEDRKADPMKRAQEAYEAATGIASTDLTPTHPIRLGLALNFSVFHYEILNQPEQACKMAQQAFDEAINELDSVAEDSYRDSTLIMQLLRDNLTLWTSDPDGAKPSA